MPGSLPFPSLRYQWLQTVLDAPPRGVWQTQDLLLHQRVALKAVAASPDSPQVRRLKQEYRLQRQLVHPAFPKALALEHVAPSPNSPPYSFITSEWIDGPALPVLAGSLSEAQLLSLARSLLEAVGWLHVHHCCHLDLKPEHVLLSQSGWKFLDVFELAAPDQPLAPRTLTGTLDWMAPEVLATGHGTVRSDLFSLGRLLELAGASRWSRFDVLLEALLAPSPHQRPADTTEALACLDPSLTSWRERAPTPIPPWTGPLSAANIQQEVDELQTSGGVLRLEGPAGSGKTRLLHELFLVWQETGQPTLYSPDAPRDLCELVPTWLELVVGITPSPALQPSQDSDQTRVLRALRRISACLTHLRAQTPQHRPPSCALFVTLDEGLNPASRALLSRLCQQLQQDVQAGESKPGLVVVLRASEAIDAAAEKALTDAMVGRSFKLPPWTLEQAAALADGLLGAGTLHPADLKTLLTSADGYPGPLTAALERRWRAPGPAPDLESAQALGSGASWLLPAHLPDAARCALQLVALQQSPWWESDLHALLQRAFPDPFRTRTQRAEALDLLLSRGLLRVCPASTQGTDASEPRAARAHQLVSERLRTAVVLTLAPIERQRLERLAGEQLEVRASREEAFKGAQLTARSSAALADQTHLASRWEELARHYHAAELGSRAVGWAHRAAQLRWEQGQATDTLRAASLALEHLDRDAPAHLELLLLKAEASYASDRYEEARQSFLSAQDILADAPEEPEQEARLAGGLGLLAARSRQLEEGQTLLLKALNLLPETGTGRARRLRWLHALAWIRLQLSQWEAAEATLREARRLLLPGSVEAIDQQVRESWLALRRTPTSAQALQEIPRLELALDQALKQCHLRGAELIQNRLAEAHVLAGHPEAAVTTLRQFADAAQATLSRQAEASARQNLGNLLLDLERYAEAQSALARAEQLYRNIPDPIGLLHSQLILVDGLWAQHRLAECDVYWREAQKSARSLTLPPSTQHWLERTRLRLELSTLATGTSSLPPAQLQRLEQHFRQLAQTLEQTAPGALALRLGILADALECTLALGNTSRVLTEIPPLFTTELLPLTVGPRRRLERLLLRAEAQQTRRTAELSGSQPAAVADSSRTVSESAGTQSPAPGTMGWAAHSPTLPEAGTTVLEPDQLLRWLQPLMESRDEYHLSEALGGVLSALTGAVTRFIWLDAQQKPRRLHGQRLDAAEFARLEQDALRQVCKTLHPWEELDVLSKSERHRRTIQEDGVRSALCWPVVSREHLVGGLYLAWPQPGMPTRPSIRRLVEGIAALAAKWHPQVLPDLHELQDVPPFEGLVGDSPALRTLRRLLHACILHPDPRLTIFFKGEVGVGKTHLARLLHTQAHASGKERRHSSAPFVSLSLATSSPAVLEKALFGVERGAFSGAEPGPGALEAASGGTLFLDELGKCPLEIQQKLLTVLSPPHTYTRLGGMKALTLNARIVFAANEDLTQLVRSGRLQHDLPSRFDVTLPVPPLRDWGEDGIRTLAEQYLTELLHPEGDTRARLEQHFEPPAQTLLLRYDWPENVRQLKRVLRQNPLVFQVLVQGKRISKSLLEQSLGTLIPMDPERGHLPAPEDVTFPTHWKFSDFARWSTNLRRAFCEQAVARLGSVDRVEAAWQGELSRASLYNYLRASPEAGNEGSLDGRATGRRR